MNFSFFLTGISFGIALAMDAFSVSLANGLNCPCMPKKKMLLMSGIFACLQALMPLAGWFVVHMAAIYFEVVRPFIPWIALALLGIIGGKMLLEGIHNHEEACNPSALTVSLMLVQGIATSIDALAVGFTMADYDWVKAIVYVMLIAFVTFWICLCGVMLGRKFGTKLAGNASILGGLILIAIGIEICLTNLF